MNLGTIRNNETLLEFAKLGVYNQLDLFGTECSLYQLAMQIDMPSDAQRMDSVVLLAKEGYEDRILMSHDIHTKHRLVTHGTFEAILMELFLNDFFFLQIGFGGHGYAHILNNVLPKLKLKGLTDDQINKITITNPANWVVLKN